MAWPSGRRATRRCCSSRSSTAGSMRYCHASKGCSPLPCMTQNEGSLALARDRFGIKPLYVHDQDDAFVFASEVRALRPWIRFEPDMLSISSYLYGFGGPTSGYSVYKNVTIVPPGTVVVIRPGRRACYRRFWRVQDFWNSEEVARLKALKPSQIVDEVEERLFESVRMQLLADAPVGVLCSGGLDSSVITAMASRIHNNLAIFHANVVGPLSELDAATEVARHLKLDLKAVEVLDQDSIDTDSGSNAALRPAIYLPSELRAVPDACRSLCAVTTSRRSCQGRAPTNATSATRG